VSLPEDPLGRFPPEDAEHAPFWEAAAEGRLVLRDADSAWAEVSGLGAIENIEGGGVTVRLDEGLRFNSRMIGPMAGTEKPGDRVRCVFEARGGGVNLPCFVLDQR